jgi:heme-degrading monooxygenase HmoA
MFVRVSRIQLLGGDMDERIANYPSAMAPLEGVDGYMGCGLLVDRDSNTALSVTYWATAEARHASEEAAARIRASTVGEQVRLIEVDRFEEAIVERTRPAGGHSYLRISDIQGVPSQLDAAIAFARDKAVPVLKAQPGFRAILISVNRETGRMIAASVWESAEARAASESAVRTERNEAAQLAGASGARVELFEGVYVNVKMPTPA